MRLEGKVAIITGGANGMGAEEARLFAREGAKVVVADIREEDARKVEAEIAEAGGDAMVVILDVSQEDQWERAVAEVVAKFGKVDILVNNAGLIRPGTIKSATEEDWDLQIDVNLKGPFLMSNAFLPHMNEGSSILNIASTVGLRAMRGAVAYCASKGGVVNLTRAMALDLAGKIRVNCICPAVVDTPMIAERLSTGRVTRQDFDEVQPIGRMGKPEEIAAMALHLCGPESEWTTGSIITVDGGQTAG